MWSPFLIGALVYYGLYVTSVLKNMPAAVKESKAWTARSPRRMNTTVRNVNTKNLKSAVVKVDHTRFSDNLFHMMSLFFPVYEGGIVREVHVKDTSTNRYVCDQERKHIKVHTDLNDACKGDEKASKLAGKYLRFIYNLYVGNRFAGIGNYMAEIGFFFKAQALLPNLDALMTDKNMQKVFAWHLYEEFEHGFDFGLPIIEIEWAFLRMLCSCVGVLHYRNIWFTCVELPAAVWTICAKPSSFLTVIYNNIYMNCWNKGRMDAKVIAATTLQRFPTWEQRDKLNEHLTKIINDKYDVDLNAEVINF